MTHLCVYWYVMFVVAWLVLDNWLDVCFPKPVATLLINGGADPSIYYNLLQWNPFAPKKIYKIK